MVTAGDHFSCRFDTHFFTRCMWIVDIVLDVDCISHLNRHIASLIPSLFMDIVTYTVRDTIGTHYNRPIISLLERETLMTAPCMTLSRLFLSSNRYRLLTPKLTPRFSYWYPSATAKMSTETPVAKKQKVHKVGLNYGNIAYLCLKALP